MITPMYLHEGDQYVKPIKGKSSQEDLDNIYNLIARREDYVTHAFNSEEALEN